MPTPQELRKIRLKNDYKEMQNIKTDIILWEVIEGEIPYVESYRLTVNVRTIINSMPEYRNTHIIDVDLSENYPISPPRITMQSTPQPFHPNWFSDKRWCYGTWNISEGLGHHVVRMIRTLQFDLEITNPDSPANYKANRWFLKNKNKGLFPSDNTTLPDPSKSRFSVKDTQIPKFRIKS
ncbi:MAG: hypothetical protein GY941_29315 [Planctomycetes bacterium]|nr:hypothetical protein [Planctomycetota bacterium]